MKKQLLCGAMAVCASLTLFPSAVFAQDNEEPIPMETYYSDVTDIIGLPSTPDSGADGADGETDTEVIIPDTNEFYSNEDFKPYDRWYPQKDRYGDYTLKVPQLKGRLTFFAGDNNRLTGRLYAPGVSENDGWKDATKRWGGYDNGLCFAASSSNLISWYLNQYIKLHPENQNDYELDVEKVFDRFRNGWNPFEGGNQKEALSWYFTGGFPSGNPDPYDNHLTGRENGGYLSGKILHNTSERWSEVSLGWQPPEVFSVFGGYTNDNKFPFIEDVGGMIGTGVFSTWEGFSEQIVRQLHYGACTISIVTDRSGGGGGHAITLWGVDYEVETGLVTAIHVTDSDDGPGRLFTVKTERGNADGGVRLINYPYHAQGEPQKFTRIRDSIMLYAPEVVETSHDPVVPDEITSDKYPIDENKNITGIQPNETLESIQKDLTGQNIKVFDAKGNPVATDAPLGTGYVLTTAENASAPQKLTVVVCGDVNGDALVDMTDVSILQQALVKIEKLDGIFQKAATFKSHSETGPELKDVIALKQFVLKISTNL